MSDAPTTLELARLARAAARRYLAREHRILLRTLVRDDVAWAMAQELCSIEGGGDPTPEVVEAAIEQIKAVHVTYAWFGEEPICGAEPGQELADMGCKPCSLPAGHDLHRYPYPMPSKTVADLAAEQGVRPVESADDLATKEPLTDDEYESFTAAIRECRSDEGEQP